MSADWEDSAPLPSREKTPAKENREPPLFFFEVLARGAKEVLIDHKSQVYRLRVTKNGKLILNK